jgi:uncharacterized membrane protein
MNGAATDGRVEQYLERLWEALAPLPAEQRQEIYDDVRAHIDDKLAASGRDEATVAQVLDRLGDPTEIARGAGVPDAPRTWHSPWAAVSQPQARTLEIVAVIMLTLGSVILPGLGWLIGVVLLWCSHRFTTTDKWLGTVFVPGGLGGLLLLLVLFGLMPTSSETFSSGRMCRASIGHASHCATLPATTSTTIHWGVIVVLGVLVILMIGTAYTIVRLIRRVARMSSHRPDLLAT